jgi:hypothetical protein
MSVSVFPDIDGAFNWYMATRDGLHGLRAAIRCGAVLSEEIHELIGMTPSEWHDYRRQQDVRHSVFATLALFAACEGGIRRDFDWRSTVEFGPIHSARFRRMRLQADAGHVSLHNILTAWIGAERDRRWLHQRLKQLLELFQQRNDLAHGRIGVGVAVEPIYEHLCLIRDKWSDGVPDFRGY